MERVTSVRPLENWRLQLTFQDGTNGIVSLKDRLFGPMFEPIALTRSLNAAVLLSPSVMPATFTKLPPKVNPGVPAPKFPQRK